MNRRLEDEIAKLAFGDADPKRTAEIERLAASDPEVRRALSQYQAMREGLQAMTPSIEHQLSSERLREEILQRGLKPKSRGFDWRWASVPLAAAGAFALAFWWPSGTSGAPAFVEPTTGAAKVALSAPAGGNAEPSELIERSAPPTTPIPETSPIVVRTSPRAVVTQATPKRSIKQPERVAMKTAYDTAAPGGMRETLAPGPSSFFGAGVASVAAPAAEQPESGPIVVIQPVRDANTGAYRATEVASPSNVLIGS